MEIKVLCACGTKYKFDVEPVNQRMPWPVNCPACGVDGTSQANGFIQQTAAASPPTRPAAIFVAPSAPPAAPPPQAAAIPPAPPSAGLRINRAAPPPAPPPLASAAPPPIASSGTPPPPPQPFARPQLRPQSAPSGTSGAKKVLAGGLTFLVAAVVTFKIIRLIGGGVHLAEAIKEVSDVSTRQWNLTADNQVILYVKHTNHTEVAEACVSYWKDNLHRVLRILPPEKEAGDAGEYEVLPPHNGYIMVVGSISDWKDPQYEGAAQFLSQKFNTMVFEEKDVDFSGAFVFGVFDQGTNLFHARLNVSVGDEKDTVTVVHPEWAIANGYKPGKDGFNDFDIRNADDLTRKFGMKFYDQGDKAETNFVLLKDPVAARATSE
jgi:hypothetical protein